MSIGTAVIFYYNKCKYCLLNKLQKEDYIANGRESPKHEPTWLQSNLSNYYQKKKDKHHQAAMWEWAGGGYNSLSCQTVAFL